MCRVKRGSTCAICCWSWNDDGVSRASAAAAASGPFLVSTTATGIAIACVSNANANVFPRIWTETVCARMGTAIDAGTYHDAYYSGYPTVQQARRVCVKGRRNEE